MVPGPRGVLDHVRQTQSALRGDGRGFVLFAVAFGWFLTLGTRFMLPAVLPQVTRSFEITDATAGVAISVIWAGYALMQFPGGLLADRIGSKHVITASLALGVGSLALLAGAPAFAVFLVGCAAFGLGSGLFGAPRGVVLSNTFPEHDGTAFGLTLAAGSLGSALLPLLAGVTAARFGWQPTIAMVIPGFALVAVLAWRYVPDHSGGVDRPTGVANLARRVAASALDRRIGVPAAAMTVALFVFQGFSAFFPTYLIRVKGFSQPVAAALFALLFVAGAGFQIGIGSVADRYGERPVLVVVAAISALTLLVLPYVSGLLPLAALVVATALRFAIAPVTSAYVVDVLPDEVEGTTWGVLRSGFFLIASTGSTFVGVFASHDRLDAAFLVLGGLTVISVVLYAFLPNRDAASAA